MNLYETKLFLSTPTGKQVLYYTGDLTSGNEVERDRAGRKPYIKNDFKV